LLITSFYSGILIIGLEKQIEKFSLSASLQFKVFHILSDYPINTKDTFKQYTTFPFNDVNVLYILDGQLGFVHIEE